MEKIFKWFTLPDDQLTLVRLTWFTSKFDENDFLGIDRLLYLFLRFCANMDVPAVKQYLESFMKTEGKRCIKQYNIRLDTMDNFRYDEPASLEEAVRVVTVAALAEYEAYCSLPVEGSSFKVDMKTFIEEQKTEKLQYLMAEAFPRLSNGDNLDEVMDDMDYQMESIRVKFNEKILDDLDFMTGRSKVMSGERQMQFLVDTGIPCIDEDIGGLFTQMVWSFTASPGTGKTRFVESCIIYRALVYAKLDVLMDELELSEMEVRNMLIAHHIVFLYKGQVKIPDSDMNKNRLTPEQRRYYEAAKIDLFESGKYGRLTVRTGDLVVETVKKETLSFLKHNRNCKVWVIDYAGLAKSKPIEKFAKRFDGFEIIVEVYKAAKEIAKTADIGAVIINQFNDKGVEAAYQGKRILPGMVQGGHIVSRHADYDLAMTMTEAQELAGMRMLSTVKKRAAKGFQNKPIRTDLSVSMFSQMSQQE